MSMFRYFTTSQSAQSVGKNALAKLRKKTGFTFANCRKALELHENDVTKAEEWLREQAKALGWAKATKLEGRVTVQGLIGIATSKEKGVMVEVNCETDFVARNKKFKRLVETVAATCLKHPFPKQLLGTEELKSMTSEDGTTLSDQLALVIGDIGENVNLKRAFCFTTDGGLKIAGATHPAPTEASNILLGKYGALIAYTAPDAPEAVDLGRQLCQHIIGMSPKSIGEFTVDEASPVEEDEGCMIHQEYLLDPDQTVGQILSDRNANVVAFRRFECGEPDEPAEDAQLEDTETIRSSVNVH